MNIAFLTNEYVTESNFDGGLANYLYRVSQTMKQRGHHIEIFTYSDKNETIFHQGIMIHRVKINSIFFRLINTFTRYRIRNTLFILLLSYSLRNMFLKSHRELHFDIIQTCSVLACGLLLTFKCPIPIVTRISSYEPLWRKFYKKRLTFDQRIVEWLEIISLKRSNGVYSPSRFLSNVLHEKENIEAEVIRPPFLLDSNNFDESIYKKYLLKKKYFIFFGTIGLLKGGEVLAESLPFILSQFPEMYFVFVGKDTKKPDGYSMLQYIIKNVVPYEKQIIYLGELQHSQLYPIIKHSKAVVLPSLVDNFPNTMLEAMDLGKVVIGTKGTSFEEFIEDGISGILVEPNNLSELHEAMRRVWNMSDEERKKIGDCAKRCAKTLSPENTCSNLEQYFQKFIKNKVFSKNG